MVYQTNTSIAKTHTHHFLSFSISNQIKIIKVMWPWNKVFTKYDYIVCLSGKRLDRDVWKVFWSQSNNPSAIQAKVGFFSTELFSQVSIKKCQSLYIIWNRPNLESNFTDGSICSVGIALCKGLFGDLGTDHVQRETFGMNNFKIDQIFMYIFQSI